MVMRLYRLRNKQRALALKNVKWSGEDLGYTGFVFHGNLMTVNISTRADSKELKPQNPAQRSFFTI